jgi:hypothetical protein
LGALAALTWNCGPSIRQVFPPLVVLAGYWAWPTPASANPFLALTNERIPSDHRKVGAEEDLAPAAASRHIAHELAWKTAGYV